MSAIKSPDVAAGLASGLRTQWLGFSRWWMSGLVEVTPSSWFDRLARRSKTSVLLRPEGADVVARIGEGRAEELRVRRQSFAISSLLSRLQDLGLQRDQISLGVVLERDLFFVRDINLPAVAVDALPRILDQEVLHRTPFQLSEIWHSTSVVSERGEGVGQYRHWILSKERARSALKEIGLEAGDIDFFATSADGEVRKVITLSSATGRDPAWVATALKTLGAASVGVVFLALVTLEWTQNTIAEGLEASLGDARRELVDQSAGNPEGQLAVFRSQPGLLQVWDELSRVLPDHTFLTDLRVLQGGGVTISGYSGDAARLVRTLDGSPLFAAAALAEAITPDAAEQKDHFSISLRLRGVRAGVSTSSDSGR